MVTKTTVKGYRIERVPPRIGELERWAVFWEKYFYGYITKAVYKGHVGEKPVVFWFCRSDKQFGYRTFTDMKVANTRTQVIMELVKLREGKNSPWISSFETGKATKSKSETKS
jgi:hypothetical protein